MARDGVVVAGRRLHRHEREHLQEVVLDDVAECADPVVERPAALDPEVLGHRDLDRVDVLTAPHRLEQGVGEPQVHDVLHGLLAEKVVDAVQALLRHERGQAPVQLARRDEICPEGLLHDEARVVQEARASQVLGALEEGRRRNGEVEDRALRLPECLLQLLVEGVVHRVAAHVRESREEGVEDAAVETVALRRLDRRRVRVRASRRRAVDAARLR